MNLGPRRSAATLVLVGIGSFGLSGCGGSAPQASANQSSDTPTSPSVAASPTSPASDTAAPLAVAQKFVAAVMAKDPARACELVVPDQQGICTSQFAPLIRQSSVSLTFHRVAISGDRALVSETGRVCFGGHCQDATDPDSGMPSATLTFAQAWDVAQDPSTGATAGSPMQRVNGKWYVVIG